MSILSDIIRAKYKLHDLKMCEEYTIDKWKIWLKYMAVDGNCVNALNKAVFSHSDMRIICSTCPIKSIENTFCNQGKCMEKAKKILLDDVIDEELSI